MGSDVMGFGKFASRTYHDVLSTEPKYVEWARQTEMEGDVSIYLKAKAKQSPKGKVMQKGYLTETYEETPSASSTSSDVATLAAVVAQLVQEVKTMKEEKVKNVPDMFEGLLGQQRIELVDV